MSKSLSRREFLRGAGVVAGGLAAMLAGCQPKVVEVTREVEKIVEKEVEKEVTVVVEQEAQPAQPTDEAIELMAWSLGPMNPDTTAWKDYQTSVYGLMGDRMPNVTLQFKDMGWDEVLRQNLVTGLLGGTAPDIIVNESFIQPYARQGAYLPLDDPLEEAGILSNLIPGTYANAVADGKIYGISVMTGVFAFESNPNVVEEAGLDPNEWPETWDELLARCKSITEAGNGDYFGYTLQGPVGFLVGGIMRYNVFAGQNGAPMCKEDCTFPYFDDPKLEPVLAFLREVNRYTPPGLTFNPNEPQVYSQLHQGVSAYQIGANWHIQWAREHGIEDSVQYGPVPLPPGGQRVSRTVGNLIVLAMSGTEYPEESIDFIKILTEDEVTRHIYEASSGRTPSTYSGLEIAKQQIIPQHEIFVDILENAEVGAMPQWPTEAHKVWTAFNDMMMNVLSTEDPISGLQAEAQAAAEKAIAEAK
jgi:ABC-type glycerol-3-phosphate transport system substrate-binding protein